MKNPPQPSDQVAYYVPCIECHGTGHRKFLPGRPMPAEYRPCYRCLGRGHLEVPPA